MIIRIEGKLTAGYYNAMEAGHPVFIDDESLSDLVKAELHRRGLDDNFCYGPFECEGDVDNPMIGKRVTLTLEVHDVD